MLVPRLLPEPSISGEKTYPLSQEKDIPYLGYWLVTIGNYKNTPLSRAFSWNLETTPPKYPPSWENGNMHAAPLVIQGGGGGGGGRGLICITTVLSTQSFKHLFSSSIFHKLFTSHKELFCIIMKFLKHLYDKTELK